MTPERERGRPCKDAPGKLAAKLATEAQSTAGPAAIDPSGVVMLEDELRAILDGAAARPTPTTQAALTDTERLSMALVDTFGPTWARRLASELESAADDIAPRRPFPGGGGR